MPHCRCKTCKQHLTVPKDYKGQKPKCPRCKSTMTIPLDDNVIISEIDFDNILKQEEKKAKVNLSPPGPSGDDGAESNFLLISYQSKPVPPVPQHP